MWTVPENYIPAIALDIFPAHVTISAPGHPDIELDRVRLVTTRPLPVDPGARVFVFHETATGPDAHTIAAPLSLEPYTSAVFSSSSSGYRIGLGDPFPPNSYMIVVPSGGCGCGSNLRAFRPFHTMQHVSI
jgi:hypothetical protein